MSSGYALALAHRRARSSSASKDAAEAGHQSKDPRGPQSSLANASQAPSPTVAHNSDFLEQQLIPPTSRLSRLHDTVPDHSSSLSQSQVAIPAFQNIYNYNSSQDVHFLVNSATSSQSSTAPPSIGQPTHLETSVSSSSPPFNHVLNHPIRRPRTSRTFNSAKELAVHYGLPTVFPTAPSVNPSKKQETQPQQQQQLPPPQQQQPPSPPQQQPLHDFSTLSANYLNMLSGNDSFNPMASAMTVSPADLEAPVVPDDDVAITLEEIFGEIHSPPTPPYPDFLAYRSPSPSSSGSPDFSSQENSNAFLRQFYPSSDLDAFTPAVSDLSTFTPAMPELLHDFETSPLDTPYAEFLHTPLVQDDSMLTSPSFKDDRPLFGGIDYSAFSKPDESMQPPKSAQLTASAGPQQPLYTISPSFESPYLDFEQDFPAATSAATASPFTVPSSTMSAQRAPASGPTRRSKATGVRKGITPEALLDENAPTQPRKYVTPSATSRKDVPAAFARKQRARSVAADADAREEDELARQISELDPNDVRTIELKRRQNTIAARRSRKRKLEELLRLKEELAEEKRVKEIWRTRALTMQSQLQSLGVVGYNYSATEFDPAPVEEEA